MTQNRRFLILGALLTLGLLMSACSIELERNEDGSLTATTSIGGAELESELELALSFGGSQVQELELDLNEGSIDVWLERQRKDGEQVDELSFTLELSAEDGGLVAELSEVEINGEPATEEMVERMSQRIADRLARYKENHPRRSLQSVSVSADSVTMVWRIETRYSQAGE